MRIFDNYGDFSNVVVDESTKMQNRPNLVFFSVVKTNYCL